MGLDAKYMYTKVSIYDVDIGNSLKTERYVTFMSDTNELYAIACHPLTQSYKSGRKRIISEKTFRVINESGGDIKERIPEK